MEPGTSGIFDPNREVPSRPTFDLQNAGNGSGAGTAQADSRAGFGSILEEGLPAPGLDAGQGPAGQGPTDQESAGQENPFATLPDQIHRLFQGVWQTNEYAGIDRDVLLSPENPIDRTLLAVWQFPGNTRDAPFLRDSLQSIPGVNLLIRYVRATAFPFVQNAWPDQYEEVLHVVDIPKLVCRSLYEQRQRIQRRTPEGRAARAREREIQTADATVGQARYEAHLLAEREREEANQQRIDEIRRGVRQPAPLGEPTDGEIQPADADDLQPADAGDLQPADPGGLLLRGALLSAQNQLGRALEDSNRLTVNLRRAQADLEHARVDLEQAQQQLGVFRPIQEASDVFQSKGFLPPFSKSIVFTPFASEYVVNRQVFDFLPFVKCGITANGKWALLFGGQVNANFGLHGICPDLPDGWNSFKKSELALQWERTNVVFKTGINAENDPYFVFEGSHGMRLLGESYFRPEAGLGILVNQSATNPFSGLALLLNPATYAHSKIYGLVALQDFVMQQVWKVADKVSIHMPLSLKPSVRFCFPDKKGVIQKIDMNHDLGTPVHAISDENAVYSSDEYAVYSSDENAVFLAGTSLVFADFRLGGGVGFLFGLAYLGASYGESHTKNEFVRMVCRFVCVATAGFAGVSVIIIGGNIVSNTLTGKDFFYKTPLLHSVLGNSLVVAQCAPVGGLTGRFVSTFVGGMSLYMGVAAGYMFFMGGPGPVVSFAKLAGFLSVFSSMVCRKFCMRWLRTSSPENDIIDIKNGQASFSLRLRVKAWVASRLPRNRKKDPEAQYEDPETFSTAVSSDEKEETPTFFENLDTAPFVEPHTFPDINVSVSPTDCVGEESVHREEKLEVKAPNRNTGVLTWAGMLAFFLYIMSGGGRRK